MSICKTFVCSFFALIVSLAFGNMTAMADEIKQVSVDGYEFAYVELGQGEPVVFVHGGLQDYRMWSEQLPKFAVHYRAIAYSRRNNWPNVVSPEGAPDGAADLHGEDLAAFAHALGFSKIRIVAHSSGAHAALFFAATHPDMVISLALNEPPAWGVLNGLPNSGDMLKEFAGNLAPAREALKTGDVQRGIPLFVNGVGGPGAYERRSDAEKKMNLDNVASYEADATTKRPRPIFTCDMAKAITAPVLLSYGERSPRLFHRAIDQLELCLLNRERVEIAASSHAVPWDNPSAYDQALLAFMEKH